MSTGPRVVVILLDGTDPPSIARYIDAGWLPSLAKAFRHARRIDLRSLGDLFLTSPWPCVASGVAVENHGIHAFRPIKSGTLDIVEASEHHIPTPFWETAVRAGLRASVMDVPICGSPPQEPALEGLRFLEWGSHPVVRPAGSLPPAFIAEVERRHGVHPQRDDDPATKTADELRVAQRRICQGVHARERIVMDLLDQDSPDLLVACFAEAHAAGHQFLNLTADNHPPYDAGVVAELGAAPLRQVYRAIDAAVGHILARLPADTTVLVTCMGGLRPSHGGSLLLDDILRRTGLTAPAAAQRGVARRLWRLAPVWFRRAVAKRLARS